MLCGKVLKIVFGLLKATVEVKNSASHLLADFTKARALGPVTRLSVRKPRQGGPSAHATTIGKQQAPVGCDQSSEAEQAAQRSRPASMRPAHLFQVPCGTYPGASAQNCPPIKIGC